MNKLIAALSVLVAVLLIFAGLLYFGVIGNGADHDTVPTEPTVPATTEIPTEAPTELPTEAPTEPEPIPEEQPGSIIVDGVSLKTWLLPGETTHLFKAEEFFAAAGLDEDGTAHRTEKERIQWSQDAASVTVDGTTYDTYLGQTLYIPAYEVIQTLGYPTWTDPDYGTVYVTTSARPFEIPEDVNVPVLMYHAVSDEIWGIDELFVSPSDMEEQLAYLVENGYDPIWFEDLAHVEDYDKPVILTFDDGYDDNYLELFPLLQKYNVKATVFVIAGAFGYGHTMTEAQARELADSGLVSIQSHTYSHDYLDGKDEAALIYEMEESQKILARVTGRVPSILCYPTGKYSDLSLEVSARYYLFGLKMVGGLYNTSDDPFLVNRYYVARYTDLGTFASYLSAAGT